jgi:hypothetical protein
MVFFLPRRCSMPLSAANHDVNLLPTKCSLLIPTASESQEYRDLICCESGVGLGHGLIG